jgi:hypothetical protein
VDCRLSCVTQPPQRHRPTLTSGTAHLLFSFARRASASPPGTPPPLGMVFSLFPLLLFSSARTTASLATNSPSFFLFLLSSPFLSFFSGSPGSSFFLSLSYFLILRFFTISLAICSFLFFYLIYCFSALQLVN